MLVSGFVDGRLLYIVKFPFACLRDRLSTLLERKFPDGKRDAGDYNRSAEFSLKHYRDCPDVETMYVANDLEDYQECLTGPLFKWLLERRESGWHQDG